MIHSMVVAIDSTDSSKLAQTFALDLAAKHGAKLTGIAVLDLPWIKRPMAMPIGGGAYRAHRDETLIANQTKELEEKLAAFDKLCTARGVTCQSIVALATGQRHRHNSFHTSNRGDDVVAIVAVAFQNEN